MVHLQKSTLPEECTLPEDGRTLLRNGTPQKGTLPEECSLPEDGTLQGGYTPRSWATLPEGYTP